MSQIKIRQLAVLLARTEIPIPPYIEEYVIGQIHYEEEWAQYECPIEICLSEMRAPWEGECRKKNGTEYWVSSSDSEDIKETYVF